MIGFHHSDYEFCTITYTIFHFLNTIIREDSFLNTAFRRLEYTSVSKQKAYLLGLWIELGPLCGRQKVEVEAEVEVALQLTVSQSICQGIKPILRLVTRYYFLYEDCCLKVAALSL
jgi:hypothetical protein